ncbi:MAG: hypothetical protein KBC41_04235 [Candidatus Pacebacteria bacterium]|nr:hypothetical protein [Candidatus Paceibacterota bacterium]MBP9867252.1 hypothetical protein [Candidatus Paceibacterota bacterium]
MAQVTGSVLFMKVEAVPRFPKVVQCFVERYFKETEIFGVRCYYAFRELDGAKVSFGRTQRKGVAPSHSIYLKEKVDDEISLFDWLEKKIKDKSNQDVFEITEYWDDGRYVDYD